MNKHSNGITLVALVITIIILLILAGITINLTLGKNGLLNNSQKAIEAYKIEAAKEKISLAISAFETDKQNLVLVEELEKIETLTSIITQKDNKLPYLVIVDGYEFMINENLTLSYIGKNNEINKQDGNVSISINTQNVIENHVLITLNGKAENVPIKQIDLYINGTKEKTYLYRDNQLEKEEVYTINDMEFYKEIECYAVIINTNGTIAKSETKKVKNIDTIATLNDLNKLASLVNEGITFKDETINLISDISVGENWIPIGYYDATTSWAGKYFSGTFNGNNHTITIDSLNKNEIYKSNGLFGMVIGGTIKDITLNGIIDAESAYTAGIVGAIRSGTVSNCINNTNNTDTSSIYHGGIVGYANDSLITDCTNNGIIYGSSFIGGICGYIYSSKISGCTNSNTVKCYNSTKVSWHSGVYIYYYGVVGGICGYVSNSTDNNGIENCTNTGSVTANSNTIFPNGLLAGGISGFLQNSKISKCNNKNGNIYYEISSGVTSNGGGLGGIAGLVADSSLVEQSFNTGTITSKYNNNYGMPHSGGIIGYLDSASAIKNCYNLGDVYGQNYVGGYVGATHNSSKIYNCYNATTNISGVSYIGNAVGRAFQVSGNYNSWITGETSVGKDENSTWGTYSAYSLAQMQQENSDLLALLSNGEGSNIWAQDANINGGLPYLKYNIP